MSFRGGLRPTGMTEHVSTDNRARWLALFVLCLGDLMIVLDTTIVNVALPSIRSDLGFSQTSLAWVVNAYLLTFGGFLLLGGRLGDLFGHRRLFLAGVTLFTLASIVCGLSTTKGMLIARARGAGNRRRRRLGGRAVADHGPVRRAGRPREGDGRLRVRDGRRRQHRRAARRRSHRRAQLALDLPRQRADRRRRLLPLAAPRPVGSRAGRERAARRRRRRHRHGVADARGLRDRQREPDRLDVGTDDRTARDARLRCSASSS